MFAHKFHTRKFKGGICCGDHLAIMYGGGLLGRIHKNEQLLDWPFTRLLLESLYIKNE